MSRHSFKEWFLATRPWSFPASVMPVLVSIAYVGWLAHGGEFENVRWINGVLAVLAMALFQAAGNTWSDLHDYRSGVDTAEGYGVKILTSGDFSEKEVKRLSLGLLAGAVALGLCICVMSGPWIWAIGIVGVALTVFYPWLKYRALGDVDIFLTYGVLPTLGTTYVLTGSMVWSALWLSIPVGLITVAILHVNNTRDVATDGNANITTFAMIIGHNASRAVYIAELLVPFAAVALLVVFGVLPAWTLLSLIALAPAMKNVRAMNGSTATDLGGILALDGATAQLQLVFSLLLCVSFIIASII